MVFIGKICLNNMVFHTYNGVFDEERKLGQKLEIDCQMTYSVEKEVQTDDLKETVSYADVYDLIKQFVSQHHYQLVESLANHLGKQILTDYPRLEAVHLNIRKCNLPIEGVLDNAEIEVDFNNEQVNWSSFKPRQQHWRSIS